MAETNFGNLSTARKTVWANQIWKEGRDQSFWFSNGFIGSSTSETSKPVHRITELTKTERGDQCIMQLVADLEGDGVVGDNLLEGNEEELFNDSQEITIDQLRHGVKNRGQMSEQRTVIRFRAVAKDKLSFWVADKLDELMFLTASGVAYTKTTDGATRASSQLPSLAFASDVAAPTTNRKVFAGSATSTGNLTSSDKMTWNLLVTARTKAERKKLRPLRMGGRNYYTVVLSTEQARDLRQDTTYQTIVKGAESRGSKNPLFTGAMAVVDGLILHHHNKAINTQGAVSGTAKWGVGMDVDGAQALLMGAQAMGLATIDGVFYKESDNRDYDNKQGIGVGRMVGMLKPRFVSQADAGSREDFSLLSIYTAAAA